MSQKPSIPKGTRDFTPRETAQRNYIFDTIKSVFRLYGFQQIETPAMENLTTLMGKYGEEGDKLLFKILNSGDFLSGISEEELKEANSLQLAGKIAEKGLRYDLTVPLARFVVQNRHRISFPFKRYQIQPVWRADRPQKGRYREFYQCDADVVGSNSLMNELELIQILDEVYQRLQIKVLIKLNNRKILSGIAEVIGESENLTHITVAIDKLDKIGLQKVNEELLSKGISREAVGKLQPILNLHGSNAEKLQQLKTVLGSSEIGLQGVLEMETLFDLCATVPMNAVLSLDLTLARGLNYYTGVIIEVIASDVQIGSISGGGRYDNLTGMFGMPGVSGVGISFGAERIYDVLTQLDLFPENRSEQTRILFVCFGEKEQTYCLPLLKTLRELGINAELYPDLDKMRKQMSYADQQNIPFVGIVGENEIRENKVMLRNMKTGDQQLCSLKEIIDIIQ
ncbi:MAG: histidine--tRNA ligase [Paludibacter sp.]|jgi:histidyl-tRNA synthetase|nr:histidine--tRNA ligase [Bacteroidales bacterium]